jgi:predicted dehydrogenase
MNLTDNGKSLLKFLVVGFGSIGKRHFDNLSQIGGVEVSILSNRRLNIPGTRVYSSLEETSDEDFDAVFITNETSLHVRTALLCAERRLNLFIEKPLSNSMRDVDKLVDLAGRYNLKVMVGCVMRFHPAIRSVKSLVDGNRIGRIVSARIACGQYLPDWRPGQDYRSSYSASKEKGGGVILDLIHELDYAYWFFGEAGKVFSFNGKKSDLEIDTEDVAEILIEFRNGILCEVHLDYIQRCPDRSIELIGTECTIRVDVVANKVKIFEAGRGTWETIDVGGNFTNSQVYIDEVLHFIECIRYPDKQPLINLDAGIKVLQIALASKESALQEKAIRI